MATRKLVHALLLLAVITSKYSVDCQGRTDGSNPNLCGFCGPTITVTLIIRNNLQGPFFELNTTISNQPMRELIYFLETAATQNPSFRFTAEHYGSLGYMITKINGVSASVSDKTYWRIIEHNTGNALETGVSTYIPSDNEVILFDFTTWS